jgi:hypothetical protein
MPKLDPLQNAISMRGDQRAANRASAAAATTGISGAGAAAATAGISRSGAVTNGNQRTVLKPKKLSLQEQIMLEAQQSAAAEGRSGSLLDSNIGLSGSKGAVNVSNIVPRKEEKILAPVTEDSVFKMSSRVVELD